MSENENGLAPVEVVASGVVEAQERAQIDTQIATAKRYPRAIAKCKASMLEIATLDEETAAGCFYTLPARSGGDGKPIQGPSVRMAEIALSSWGNLKAASRIIGDDGKSLTAQAVVVDLEKNVSVSIEVRRRVTNRDGRRYSDDMVNTTANAACSLALRNATFRVVPAAVIKPVYEAAKRVAIGNVKSITKTRAEIFERLKKKGVSEASILAVVGCTKIDEVDAEKVADLIGIGNAIKDGQITLEEAFPPVQPKTTFRKPETTETASQPAATPQPAPQDDGDVAPVQPTRATGGAGGLRSGVSNSNATGRGVTDPERVFEFAPAAAPVETEAHKAIAAAIAAAGKTFDDFLAWAIANQYPGAADWTGVVDIPQATAEKLAKASKGLTTALKGGAQ